MFRNKRFLILGWIVVGIILALYSIMMLISVFEGSLLVPIRILPGRPGGAVFPIAMIPLIVIALLVFLIWGIGKFQKYKKGKSDRRK